MDPAIQSMVVDDDENIRFFLESVLLRLGHQVTTAAHAEEALELLREQYYDLTILDLELGGRMDGLRLLEAIKWRWPNTATLILTAHGSLESAMAAIREGVDIYLLKPAKAEEIRLAVREAMARRQKRVVNQAERQESAALKSGPFEIDLDKRLVSKDGNALDLSGCEFSLLVTLIENQHRILSPLELVRVVRQYDCDDINEARDIVKWYIHSLRNKVESKPARPRHIINVRGVGYTFKG